MSNPIADYLGYGHDEAAITRPDRLKIGMGIHLTDKRACGFYETVAAIIQQCTDVTVTGCDLHHLPGAGLQ